MTATKAIAGGVAANIVTVILWAVSNIPGWGAVPDEPKAALIALVSAGSVRRSCTSRQRTHRRYQ